MTDLPDHDERQREYPDMVYFLEAVGGVGRVAYYRAGLALVDFYRSTHVLASAQPVKPKEETN